MRKVFYLTLLFCLCQQIVSAQKGISGIVVDDANTPIIDAYIYTKSEEHHCHSDAKGEFELLHSEVGDTMVVSFLGFGTREFILKEEDFKRKFKVVLQGSIFNLEQVSVSNSLKSVNTVTSIDLGLTPVQSSQEVLRRVPGLFIGQHAGGGKAEQIFLRGFDIDHGTDIAITVDGMPVNMVSHAHGQGYADLHFLIPETIQNIDFAKGPYYTEHGNFTTAGYVDFRTKDKLDKSLFGLEVGDFNTFRTLGMFNLLGNSDRQNAYVATEFISSDGPFESPQNFNRINFMGKYNVELNGGDRISVILSRFQSEWDASGQIPQRLVDAGTITRFGAVDDTEGGSTSRTNAAISFSKNLANNSLLKSSFFYSKYDFELFSNFTFFLEDPENSDQIRQHEDRQIYGFNSTLFKDLAMGNNRLNLSVGTGLRYDDVNDVVLSRTANRQTTLEELSSGDIDEINAFGFVDAKFDLGDWMINAGLRLDAFHYNYNDLLQPTYTNLAEQKAILLPKLNIIYNPSTNLQLFVKTGRGFHSNDTRVVVAKGGEEILPAAYGVDLGAVWKPAPRVWISPALWYLFLEQEFVYVGDAAIVEPSGKTNRQGVDLSMRVQLTDNLFFNTDFNYTYARSIDDPEGENLIPLAPDMTSAGGLSYINPNGFRASVNYRYIKDRAANEDNSIVAEGYFVTDLNTSYTYKNLTFGVEIQNLLDTEWNEAQFATESRLRDEPEPVEELHFTPGTPFFLKGIMRYRF
jgi:outer membrane receptor protein involved in Fe transport